MSRPMNRPVSRDLSAYAQWRHRKLSLDRPRLIGILNITPDSYCPASRCPTAESAVTQALRMLDEGADALDVGAESTRPGAQWVSEEEELSRLLPVLEALKAEVDVPISVDTRRASVARRALDLGVDCINDITAGSDPDMFETVAEYDAGLCLMHMQGADSKSMQVEPQYIDVISEVALFLKMRSQAAEQAGVSRASLMWDPGIGFGKLLEHNSRLIGGYDLLRRYGYPIWLGLSRKSMFDHMLGLPVEERLSPSLAATLIAVQGGAHFVRTHDVRETRLAIESFSYIINR